MSKMPAFQFYPADWRKDPGVQALSFEDRGVWFEILCLMHESPRRGVLLFPNGTKMNNEALARVIGFPLPKLVKALDRIALVGASDKDAETGAIMNRRMVKDENLRQARAEGGPKGAEFGERGREFGKLGGRPKKPATTEPVNPPENPPSIPPLKPPPSSSSSASAKKEPPTEVTKKAPPEPLVEFGEFGRARMTSDQHEKLKGKLNGNLETYIARFDRWVNEAPDAKKDGVKRKDRHAYESILAWHDRDVKEGKLKPPSNGSHSGVWS